MSVLGTLEIDGVWHEVARCDAYVHYATVGRITYRMAWVDAGAPAREEKLQATLGGIA